MGTSHFFKMGQNWGVADPERAVVARICDNAYNFNPNTKLFHTACLGTSSTGLNGYKSLKQASHYIFLPIQGFGVTSGFKFRKKWHKTIENYPKIPKIAQKLNC